MAIVCSNYPPSLLLLHLRIPEERAFFNSTTGRCEEFTGCPGRGNNFNMLEQCQQICEGMYVMYMYMYMCRAINIAFIFPLTDAAPCTG